MMIRALAIFVVVSTLAGGSSPGTSSFQMDDGALNSVPIHERANLIKHLKLLTRLQAKGEWKRLYDVLSEPFRHGDSREQFAVRMATEQSDGTRILGFDAQGAESSEGTIAAGSSGEWNIWGCARTAAKSSLKAEIVADLIGSKWRSSPILIAVRIDAPPPECKAHTR